MKVSSNFFEVSSAMTSVNRSVDRGIILIEIENNERLLFLHSITTQRERRIYRPFSNLNRHHWLDVRKTDPRLSLHTDVSQESMTATSQSINHVPAIEVAQGSIPDGAGTMV